MRSPELGGKKGKKAQAMVEFALTIPIVLVLVLGIIEGGWLLFVYASLNAAGREAARYGAGIGNTGSGVLYNDCSGIKSAAIRLGQLAGVTADNIHIYHDTGPNTARQEYCVPSPGTLSVNFNPDDRIVIVINVTYTPISPLIHLPTMPLRSESAHSIVQGADVIALPPPPTSPGGGNVCDTTAFSISTGSTALGPDVAVTIRNSSALSPHIINMLVVWDTTSGPVLNSITGVPNPYPAPGQPALPNSGPAYTSSSYLALTPGTVSTPGLTTFTLRFSRVLKSAVIIRLTLDDALRCTIGQ